MIELTEVDERVRWAYRQPRSLVTRRLAIYESDGETLWEPSANVDRLVSGSINISYDRDERRQLSGLVLANFDGRLAYDPNGFWYDKILKLWRGTKFTADGQDYFYEQQIGEFMIDQISDKRFPHHVEVNGRDRTKRLLNDQFPAAVSFPANTRLDDLVKTIATNAGIMKFRAGAANITLGSTYTIDKDTSRWAAIKNACTPHGVDVFFSADGYLTTKLQIDVSTDPASLTFGHEDDTEGATAWERSITDTGIFNHIVVRSASSDADVTGTGLIAVRSNTGEQSPTSIQRIGRRTKVYESELFTTQDQVDEYADNMLKVSALETFEIKFGFRFMPWMDVATIINLPQNLNDKSPTRFLLTDLDASVGVGVMSGTAKRVVIVG